MASLAVVLEQGLYGFAAGGQLVDDRYVEVAVDRHGQGAGDRGGRHHQNVGRRGVLVPEAGALFYAEPVLLVDDDKAQVGEVDRIFEQGMGADEQVDLAGEQPLENGGPPLLGDRPGEKLDAQPQRLDHRFQPLVVLGGQYLGGGHQASLVAVVDGDKHAHEGHQGFAAAHVALQQPVHLPAAAHVGPYLFDDPLLGLGELKGKYVVVEVVEAVADVVEPESAQFLVAQPGVSQDVELQIEELFEFEPHLGPAQVADRYGEMDVAQGIGNPHQLHVGDDGGGQGFGQWGLYTG